MRIAPNSLPNDPEALKRLVIEQYALIEQTQARLDQAQVHAAQQRERLESQASETVYLRVWVEKLKLQIARLKRMQFGRSSEQRDAQIDQLELILEELKASQSQLKKPAPPVDPAAADENKKHRKPLPDHLKRENKEYAPPTDCTDCGKPMQRIGEDVAEQLEFVPEHFKVIRHVRPKFACSCCTKIVQWPAPSRPIAHGYAGPALLARVVVGKYCDHLPLYRQSQIYARAGVALERSTMADWVGQIANRLQPIAERIARYTFAGDKVHADDTPMPVLQPGRTTTKTGRLWAYVRDDQPASSTDPPAAVFRYSPDRKQAHPLEHLQTFSGILQADAYAGYNSLYEQGPGKRGLIEAACWAHVRRKFFDLEKEQRSPIAAKALDLIGELYAIEANIRGKPASERQAVRETLSRAKLVNFNAWLKTQLASISNKTELAGAIRYALNLWPALTRFCDDGHIEIDNNAVERALRAAALGRKNYLFLGSDAGGQRAATMYTLIATAKLNGLDPEAYLRNVLTRIIEQPDDDHDALLPWNI